MLTLSKIINICHEIEYKDWVLDIHHIQGEPRPYVRWRWLGKCSRTGEAQEQRSRKYYISKHMTNSEVVQTVFLAALQAEEHEVREFFLFNHQPIFRPHYDVYRLLDLCEEGAVDTRQDPSTRSNDHEINTEFDTLVTDAARPSYTGRLRQRTEGRTPDGDRGNDGISTGD